ncbi:glycoside hydrolase superfamily [Naematelia encephala]|uniref:glucan 1,3-beta-glucosidase n=1 Tax=Naematelia encephala TaxID=71784 RepID=A0A1Y2AUL4_9TREE|nr:glycoside hydrolase superfamily [Naematelia encephala]
MTYANSFGGYWVWDEADPFNNGAKANSWTPALNESWTWGVDKIHGVNLGGWLVTEPFICSSLYETYSNGTAGTTVDEYTLSINLGDNLTAVMTEHYDTFITERDFAEIASAGLNWVRIPVPFWAIETWDGEPYLEGVAWQYILKAIQWARKYGIRINLDFHALPGSQNGWNHSGHVGSINWLNGVMGLANAQRGLDYIRTLAQFISQPEYSPIIQNFGFINEPNAGQVSQHIVGTFYNEAYTIIRDITGIGEGNGPYLSVHDGFLGIQKWYGFLTGADRLALDQHPYMIFGDQPTGTLTSISHTPCSWWAASTNTTSATYGVNNAGEWSAATNDCGLWVNAVGAGSRYDGTYEGYTGPTPGSCDYWNDYTQWNQSTINDLNHFVKASMDALQNYFFWTWKIGNSTGSITEVNPFWHYRLGLAHGWIPTDPREAIGTCAGDGVADSGDFNGTFSAPYMTGGAGAGTIDADQLSTYAWPPPSFTNVASSDMSLLPQYTQTRTPITLSGPTFTSPGASATIDAGNGWANPSADARQAYTAISGCSYPPEYSAANLTPTAGACGADLTQPTKRNAVPAAPTPAPARQ